MKDARFTIPTPALLAKVVDTLDGVPMDDRDTKGDLDEYMLGKIASARQNGQFRTPRHIIQLMVELTAPTAGDVICDPASGTCGFLVMATGCGAVIVADGVPLLRWTFVLIISPYFQRGTWVSGFGKFTLLQ